MYLQISRPPSVGNRSPVSCLYYYPIDRELKRVKASQGYAIIFHANSLLSSSSNREFPLVCADSIVQMYLLISSWAARKEIKIAFRTVKSLRGDVFPSLKTYPFQRSVKFRKEISDER